MSKELCSGCGIRPKTSGGCYCRACHTIHDKPTYLKLKAKVMAAYGGKCNCPPCGETIVDFLCIDHLNNDGAKQRKILGLPSGRAFYRWLVNNNYPPGFQVLCCNCNLSKHTNKGKCVHETMLV